MLAFKNNLDRVSMQSTNMHKKDGSIRTLILDAIMVLILSEITLVTGDRFRELMYLFYMEITHIKVIFIMCLLVANIPDVANLDSVK